MLKPLENISAVSGQDCPQSGIWRALDTALPPLLVARGHIMPGVDGRVVTWVLFDENRTNPPHQQS